MINIEDFKEISLRGRVAYAICCTENALLAFGVNNADWKMVFEKLWSFTSTNDMEYWMYSVAEIVPENLIEFKNYEENDFEYLSKSDFEFLYNIYMSLGNKFDIINKLIHQIYYLGTAHAYSVITNYGIESIIELEVFIKVLTDNSLPLCDIEPFKKYSIDEAKGWGNTFDGRALSKII